MAVSVVEIPIAENDFRLDVVIVKVKGSVTSDGNNVIQNVIAKDDSDDDADHDADEEDRAAMVLHQEVACNHVKDRHDAVIIVVVIIIVNELHCFLMMILCSMMIL